LNAPIVFLRIFTIIQDDADRFRRAYLKACLAATVIGFPAFAALIVIAPQLIEVLYGPQWLPAVLPFQILCVAGASRVTLAYASAAIQASGQIWSETWRHGIYMVLIVVGVSVLSMWGIVGVAMAVAIATGFMMVLMQGLVCRVTGLKWTEIVRMQVPALAVAVSLAVALLLTDLLVNFAVPSARPWQVLTAQVLVGAIVFPACILFGPFGSVRQLASETVTEFAPGLAKYLPIRSHRVRVGESAIARR
jgi:PST family polysaccharide transporter